MARQRVQSITTLDRSPTEERQSRMLKYSVAMGVRFVCVIVCFFVHGWWLLLPAIGAIVLPYIGVVIANTVVRRPERRLDAPAGVLVLRRDPPR
jgi:hypothetical protein